MNKEYVNLIEASNAHFDAVCDYIDNVGIDEYLEIAIQNKILWLKKIAKDYNISLDEC